MIGLNSYLLAGGLAASLAVGTGAYLKGRADANANCEARVSAMLLEAQRAKDAEAEKAAGAATVLETKNAEARVVYRTITRNVNRIVERPIYVGQCFDQQGVDLANAALAGVAVAVGMLDGPPAALTGPPAAPGQSGRVVRSSDAPR